MAELNLEPYVVSQNWILPGSEVSWEALLAEYFQDLAKRCQQEAGKFLGHIKGLALFEDGHYLRISVIDPLRPASLEGNVPGGQNSLELTLNVIVYGLKHGLLERIVEELAEEFARDRNVEVISQAIHHH